MNIPLAKPDIGNRELEYVRQTLTSGQLSLGPRLQQFEREFAKRIGVRNAIATSSGTAALHLCVRALGIGAKDEVITSPFSFVASANCILYEGAWPAFVDIDPTTLNIDVNEIRAFLREQCIRDRSGVVIDRLTGCRVAAILPVHVFGLPCDMEAIREIAQEYGLRIIEDACEAIGAEYKGRNVGSFGDASVFAFYPNKQMTTGEGGMIVSDDNRIADICRSLRNQGRDDQCAWLQHTSLGFNYRLSDIHCALGLAQLERLDDLLERRTRAANTYNSLLAGDPLLSPLFAPQTAKRSWFVYVVRINLPSPVSMRESIINQLRAEGIGCQAYFPAIHRQPYWKTLGIPQQRTLANCEAASDSCLALPFFTTITTSEIEQVVNALHKAIDSLAVLSGELVA